MDDYEVTLNLADGRVVVVPVRATSQQDAIGKARFEYGQQDATAQFNFDVAPVVRLASGGGAASGGNAGAGRGGDPRQDYPFYNRTTPGAGSRGSATEATPTLTGGTPTLGSGGFLGALTREDNIELLANEGDNEGAAIRQAYRDLNPGSSNNSSVIGGLLDQFLSVLTNAYEGASASGRLDPNTTVSQFVGSHNPRSARRETAANLLALLSGEGIAGETAFDASEATDQLVSASGAYGSSFRQGVQGRLTEFNRAFQGRQLEPGATDRGAYSDTLDELFPELRRALARQAGGA